MKINVITTFSGYDSQCLALEAVKKNHPDFDYNLVAWCEIDKYAITAHDLVFPQWKGRNVGDITKVDWNQFRGTPIDLFTYSSPCFVAGTLVLTSLGFKRIEDVNTEDFVLTHTNSYKKVLRAGSKPSSNIIRVKGMGIHEIFCTPNHPFYTRRMYRYGHKSLRKFHNPEWKAAGELTTKDYLGIAINNESSLPKWDGVILNYGGKESFVSKKINRLLENENFWYIMGRYIGDGWTRDDNTQKSVIICCSDRNEDSLIEALSKCELSSTRTKERTCYRYAINSKELLMFVDRFGHGATNKRVDAETIALPVNLLSSLLKGYVDSDGSFIKGNNEYKILTVSEELAYGVQQIVAKVYHRPSRVYKTITNPKTTIEGRVVNQHDFYQVVWHIDARKQDKAFFEDGFVWYPCNGIEQTEREEEVYNLEVEDDHSYTANGTIVHNCQDISQAGKQMGLKEGSGTRSALLWNVVDAIEALQPRYLLQENVRALVSKKFMPDFLLWCKKLEELGYRNYWQLMNAKDYGIPQNRERVFMISVREDIPLEFSFPSKVPLTKVLADVLEQDVDESFYLSDQSVENFLRNSPDFHSKHDFTQNK